MKIVCISDTHSKHNKVNIPDGDVLIHAGDLSSVGHVHEIINFNNWLGKLPHKYKIVIAGNHDWLFEKQYTLAKSLMTNCIYLQDEEITINGIKFYGSPWQPAFCNWAFNLPRGKELHRKWSFIPDDTDVLITHGPPYNILDLCDDNSIVGCNDLLNRVLQIKPKLHVFGHIHFSYGQKELNGIKFVNASICDESYQTTNKPIVIEI